MRTSTDMKIDIRRQLDGADREHAWHLYYNSFAPLNAFAVQRHLMHRAEFDAMCDNPKIEKWLVLDEHGCLEALATYTNDLDEWPLISPAYFERRWPKEYEAKAIWYCGFVAVAGDAPPSTFNLLITGMYEQAAAQSGVIGLDFCAANIERRRIDRAVALSLRRISGGTVRPEAADQQTFMVYDTARTAD